MATLESFRVFVAVYRAGSVSGAARERHLTQPAVSAQLAALEARVGEALFTRTPRGVVPTGRGRALYAQVSDSVDRLDRAARALGVAAPPSGPLRLGVTPEFLHGFVLPLLPGLDAAVAATFGAPRDLLGMVEAGTLDAALVTFTPPGRALMEHPVTDVDFVLIGPPEWSPPAPPALGAWLNARPWVSSSVELPVTRRYFTQALGVRFAAQQALVAPDLRAVVRGVELGVGATLAPRFAAAEALDAGRVRSLLPGAAPILPERWRLVCRLADDDRADLTALIRALQRGARLAGQDGGTGEPNLSSGI